MKRILVRSQLGRKSRARLLKKNRPKIPKGKYFKLWNAHLRFHRQKGRSQGEEKNDEKHRS